MRVAAPCLTASAAAVVGTVGTSRTLWVGRAGPAWQAAVHEQLRAAGGLVRRSLRTARLRWWDGNAWTEHAQAQAAAVPAARQPSQQQQPQYGGQQQSTRSTQRPAVQASSSRRPGPVRRPATAAGADAVSRTIQRPVRSRRARRATAAAGASSTSRSSWSTRRPSSSRSPTSTPSSTRTATRSVGFVEVGQSGLKKAVRVLTSYDQFLTHRLERSATPPGG